MKAQTPAEGILKQNDWGDSKVYRVACECSNTDCDHNVWVESDDTGISVNIYVTTRTNFWSKSRWAHIWTLLTKGYIDTESTICLKEQQAINYAQTLVTASADVKEFRNTRQNKEERAIITKMAKEQDCV